MSWQEIVNVLWLFGARCSVGDFVGYAFDLWGVGAKAYWSDQAVMYENDTHDNFVILLVLMWSIDLNLGLWIGYESLETVSGNFRVDFSLCAWLFYF